MSSKPLDKKHHELPKLEQIRKPPTQLSDLVISFSKFCTPTQYIYYGHEKIPFLERHPVYQTILKEEFSDALRKTLST